MTVRIPIDSPVPSLQVPAESIRPGEQLWVARDGKLRVVTISLVCVDGDTALVRQEGGLLKAGDEVIVSPLASVRDGMNITTAAAEERKRSRPRNQERIATKATSVQEVKP